MNPIFLLLGLFGLNAVGRGSPSNEWVGSGDGSLQTDDPEARKFEKPEKPDKGKNQEPEQQPVQEEPVQEEPVLEEPVQEEPVQEEPVQEEPVQEEPVQQPEAPEQPGDGGSGAETTPTPLQDGTVEVMAGRVATLDPAGDVVDLRILSSVEHGTITVNPDNTFALVMTQSDFIGAQNFTYEATHADGSVSVHEVGLDVIPGLQEKGWATGESHYMLATDADDRVIVEHGENHMKVYVSGSSDALSLSDIAQIEGMSVSNVTGAWLANHDSYGQSEGMALAEDAGMALWGEIAGEGTKSSNWLLLERGHAYDGRLIYRSVGGEDELNPLYIGAWGDGERPEVTSEIGGFLNDTVSNIVIQDIHFTGGGRMLAGENIIFDNIKGTDDQLVVMYSSGITIRNSEFYDNTTDASSSTDGAWSAHADRMQGIFANFNEGLLLEGLFLDHNGWAEGYDPMGSTDDPQPPGMFSHNVYLGTSITDLTVRDTISMRASSNGLSLRSGGFFEDLMLIDNNSSIVFKGGDHVGEGPTGSYTLLNDSVVTSGGHRWSDISTGGLTLGIRDEGELTSLVDNIVTHLADPNNPDELADKEITHAGLRTENTYYDDTILYNWHGSGPTYSMVTENNVGDLDTAVLDQTTIQLFTAQLLGRDTATIEDLADYLRAQGDGAFDGMVDADLIVRFFQDGFGIAPDIRSGAETLRFVPNDLGEGVRWDNRLNWDTDDLPGWLNPDDSADLGGNDVVYGTNTAINTLDFGGDGALNVYGGRLDVTGGITGDGSGSLNVEGAGQAWIAGSDADDLDIFVQGGRFANTGEMTNADLTATGGQTLLATEGAEFDLGAGHRLELADSNAKVGFDGEDGGIALLDLHENSTLAFSAEDGDFATIAEFRSGTYGDAPNVQSGIDLGAATLEIDLSGLTASAGTQFTLMDADEIVGLFDDAVVGGLGGRDATIVIDYQNDSVTLQLSSGSGAVSVETVGQEDDVSSGEQALWDALTADHGVVSETAAAMVDEDEADPLDVAA